MLVVRYEEEVIEMVHSFKYIKTLLLELKFKETVAQQARGMERKKKI